MITGLIAGVLLTVTYRERGDRIRIISARGRQGVSGRTITARRQGDGKLVEVLPDGSTRPLTDPTDLDRLRAMTDEEVEAAAASDPDNPPLGENDLRRLRRRPRELTLRRALGLTQEAFAARYGIPPGTLRDWEHGRSTPDQPTRAYLAVIAADPDGVARLLESAHARRP